MTETKNEAAQPPHPEIKMVSKLSMANAGLNPKRAAVLENEDDRILLARIIGEAEGVKQVDDPQHGTVHFALVGRFQAIHPTTKAITRSGYLYLPKGIHESYVSLAKDLEGGAVVQFALDVRGRKSSNAAGYSYEAVDLLAARRADPLDLLIAALPKAEAAPQLTSGVKEATTEKSGATEKAGAKKTSR